MMIEPAPNLDSLSKALDSPRLFVTGTDTEIGKTIVSCQILKHWQAGGHRTLGIKPIATGCEKNDGHWVNEDASEMSAVSSDEAKELLLAMNEKPGAPLEGFVRPMAPVSAARLENRQLDMCDIDQRVRQILESCLDQEIRVVVEGLGGTMVPLSYRYVLADWIADLAIPTVVVCRTELGTISHTIQTVESLLKRGVSISAVIASRQRSGEMTEVEQSSVEEIKEQLPQIPVAVLDYIGH